MNPIQHITLTTLFNTVLEHNREDFPIWFNFSGHVNQISIQCMHGKWESGKSPLFSQKFYTDGPDSFRDIHILRRSIKDAAAFGAGVNLLHEEGWA